MTPKKLPSGKWRVQGYYKDPLTGVVSRPSFTAETKSEALRLVAEYQVKHRLARSNDMLVKDCIEQYITAKANTLSPATIRGYRAMQKNNYSPIDNMRLSNLTRETVQNFVSTLSQTLKPKTVRNVYALLTASVSMFSDISFGDISLPARQPVQYNIPTYDDVKDLLALANPSMRIAIMLAAVGTLRAGEVCSLKYKDIDREAGGIRVHTDMVKTPDNKWVIKGVPKTSASVRFVPLSPQMLDMLGDGDPDNLVYGRSPAALTCAFERLRKKLGLKCRYHDLRHFAASSMHALNIPDAFIQERGGWKTSTTLRAVYTHALSDQSKEYAEIANAHFAGLL